MDALERIATTVLYEGYVLWPYRRSATKNQKRWTLGGVYPRRFSEVGGTNDPWWMQTQCLVEGASPIVRVRVRFLQVVQRQAARLAETGALEPVDELRVGNQRYLTWDEAREREIALEDLSLASLAAPTLVPISIPEGWEEEPLASPQGEAVGALIRTWRALDGTIEASAESLRPGLFRLTVRVANETPWEGGARESAVERTFVSNHTILTVENGAFVSLMDPPDGLRAETERCENVKTWPVLVGAEGERGVMLSSPIILYDYPQVAAESPADLYDGTEIDQMLMLNVLALSDAEKEEMRASDPRARAILERSEALDASSFMKLNGVIRDFRVLRDDGGGFGEGEFPVLFETPDQPPPESILVDGVEVRKGSKVRLHPRSGADILDIALVDKVAFVDAIEQDYEERIHLAVTLEEDPGRDIGVERWIGHRFFFAPDEVEPLREAGA